ncbi:undecaprenyl-phosphate galactose phosphotransferase [freshwater sediment metagenome]|uniref:Undecaprenyl-phosphate galactose phosphotransferase n=1 Tax=freshwater sediment metagenome TaxID=556182 RepID=A0AA48M2T9_9ZZZZ
MPSYATVKSVISAWDAAIALVAPYLALWLRNASNVKFSLDSFFIYASAACVATLVLLKVSGVSNTTWRFFSLSDAVDAFVNIAMGVIVGVTVSFFYDRLESVPRSLPFIHVFIQFAAYAGLRFALKRVSAGDRTPTDRPSHVLLIGCNQTSYVYARAVETIGRGSLRVAAVLTHDPIMVGHIFCGIPIVSTFDNIEAAIGKLKTHGIQIRRLILSASEDEISRQSLDNVMLAAKRLQIPVTDIHLLFTEITGKGAHEDDVEIDIIELRGRHWILKRSLDITAAAILIALLSPLFVVTAALVLLDVGAPIFFWQQRFGRHGKVFSVFKFRTMKDGDANLHSDADRTSSIGLILRLTRLDELPQLWNILIGDMSFIGPRPLLPVDQPEELSQRLAVRPGLSGWAQVNGGRLITPEEKRALDLWYIAHASLWLDIKIAFMTIVVMVRGDKYNGHEVGRAVGWLKEHEESAMLGEAP